MSKLLSPIIIVGMHRSGTTMIANMLRKLGLFIGNDLESNSESMFFINHNDWLLRQSGGAWDNPKSIEYFFKSERLLNLSEEYIRERISGLPVEKYLGLNKFLLNQRPLLGLEQPWGWKDPRTTYTLEFWLRLFPNAKVIHIYRNGVPVAASLRARENRLLAEADKKHRWRKKIGLYNFLSKKGGFGWSTRCLELNGGFSLWEDYVNTAINSLENFAPNTFELKYEDFLKSPIEHLTDLASYCGLMPSYNEIKNISTSVRSDRGNAFTDDKELVEFYEKVKMRPLMKQLGYD